MKILLTGATGFAGRHFIKRSKKMGYVVHALVRPSTNVDFLKKEKIKYYVLDKNVDEFLSFVKKEKFDGIVHFASLFLSQHESKDIKNLVDSNIYFGSLIMEASVLGKVKWFINTGTFWQHYKNKNYSPVNLYAATKQAFEDIAKYYIESSQINFVTIKLSDTFGPNDTRLKLLNVWNKVSRSEEHIDMSKGVQRVDISYIDNIIDGYFQMIKLLSKDKDRKLNGKSFSITSNKIISLRELAEIFKKTTGRTLNINWGKKEYRLREVMNPWKNGKKIPGWTQKISLEEGIKRTFTKNNE